MAIPEAQLDTWAKQGATAQSRDTYQSVKNALHDSGSPYYHKDFESFLQGSYANDTNVHRDSDVDVAMRLDSAFYHDAYLLPQPQKEAFELSYPGTASYGYNQFRADVAAWLSKKYSGVKVGSKAIFIPGSGARRDCDVLVCANYRYYFGFASAPGNFAEGICFWVKGTQIVNFPKQHSDNCTAKHQATSEWFKPTVRIYKNIRNSLVDSGRLGDRVAPSYFIEGLLWNVPVGKFGTSYTDTLIQTFDYLVNADRSVFKCPNGIHSLLGASSNTSWSPANCQAYLDAVRTLWNEWK